MTESKEYRHVGARLRAALRGGLGLKLAALTMVLVLVAVVWVSLTSFVGGFTRTVTVMVNAPRSGLVLDPDAKVKMRGVQIGHVAEIDRTDGGEATLRLALDPDLLAMVPANAEVDIRSTTVFGAKYVNFVAPQMPSTESLSAGASVSADRVTVEFNTLFQHLSDVLAQVEPEKLNATLTALGTALQGRGDKLGGLLGDADAYLQEINPSLPALRRDLAAAAEVGRIYGDAAPDLLRTLDNVTVTGRTVVEEESNLDALLVNLTGLTDTTGAVLRENEQQVATALDLLRPTIGLLHEYSPALSCLIRGLDTTLSDAETIFGGGQEGIALNASFMWGADPYQYPEDLPKVNATGGPHCEGVADRVPGSHADYVVTDTTEGGPFTPRTEMAFNSPKVFEVLFGELPEVGQP